MGAEDTDTVDNAELSDTVLVDAIKRTLESAKNGDTYQYKELVGLMQSPDRDDRNVDLVAVAAQQEAILKSLPASVSKLDVDHHDQLLKRIFKMKFWNYKPDAMNAFVELMIPLASADGGKYLDSCLNFLISTFIWQPRVLDEKRQEVLSRVHAAFDEIYRVEPLAPSKLVPILSHRMRMIGNFSVTTFVYNLLKLENSSIGRVVGNLILDLVMAKLRDLDVEIIGDDILQDDSNRCMFHIELEDVSVFQDSKMLLDKLMVLSFKYLESSQNAGRLDEVFEILFESFVTFILNTHKSKFSQFVMFYACSLDPGNCGVKFATKLLDICLYSNNPVARMSAVGYLASYLSRAKFLHTSFVVSILKRLVDKCADYCTTCNDDVSPEVHRVFYLECQAIMYVLCFRMRSILNVPCFESQLTPLVSVLSHKLNPLMVCLPSVVSEFLKQSKACGLFIVSDTFIFDDLLESELSRAFGGCSRLDTFFPFDPCLLKITKSYVDPHFIYWSSVKTTYDEDGFFADVIVNGDTDSEEECDDDGDVLENELNKMSITPKHFFMRKTERFLKMPPRIRPSTSPCESLSF